MGFIEKWKTGESAVGRWLAETVTGTIVKTALAPVLLWAADQKWDLPPVLIVVIVAVVPAIINSLNGADSRYGIGRKNG